MTYKQVHHIRRTPKELVSFKQAKEAFLHQGYPEEIAEQYAWDCLFAARNAKVRSFL